MGVGKAVRNILSAPDAATARSADNIRKTLESLDLGSGAPGAVRRNLAGSPNAEDADRTMSLGIARELIRTPEGREQLRGMIGSMSPKAQENFFQTISRETRDPRSPAKSISLTPEGQMILDIAFKPGFEPDPAAIARVSDPADGVRLDEIELGDDSSPKAPPAAPKAEGAMKGELYDKPRFRSDERIVQKKDGTLAIKHDNVQLDGQTKRAWERAEEGKPVAPVYDDPRNTPPGKIPGNALAAGNRTPKQQFTELLNRVAELQIPNTNGRGYLAGGEQVALDDLNDHKSVFAPRGGKSDIQGSRVTTVKASDYEDLRALARSVGIKDINSFSSPEEFARALVSKAHQGGYDVTPVTASQRKQTEDTVMGMVGDNTLPSEAAAQTVARVFEPDAVKATKAAERAVVQEQVIASLARKADELMGHNGWGENYKPRSQSAGVDGPSTETGPRAGTTQDVHRVPSMVEYGPDYEATSVNTRGTVDPLPPKVRMDTGRQPMEIGEDVGMEDLDDLDQRKRFATGDPNAKPVFEGEEGGLRTGFQEEARTKKYRSPPNADRRYEDPTAQYADYNAENRSPDDLAARENEYNIATSRGVRGLNRERSSDLRRQIGVLLNSDGDLTPEQLTQLADLQQRLRGAQSLDSMSGIRSMESKDPLSGQIDNPDSPDYIPPVNGVGVEDGSFVDDGPFDGGNPADLQADKLDAAAADIQPEAGAQQGKFFNEKTQQWEDEDPYFLNGAAREEAAPAPEPAQAAAPEAQPKAAKQAKPKSKKAAKKAAAVEAQPDAPAAAKETPDPAPVDKPVDAPAGKQADDPKAKGKKGKDDPEPPTTLGKIWKWAKRAGVASAVGVPTVMAINSGGQPKAHNFNGSGGGDRPLTPEEMGFPADAMDSTFPLHAGGAIRPMLTSSEDRIRAVQAALNGMGSKLNADTMHMQNWTH